MNLQNACRGDFFYSQAAQTYFSSDISFAKPLWYNFGKILGVMTMNQATNSKFVPTLPSDDDFNPPTNENTAQTQNSIKIYDGVAECTVNESDTFKNVKIQAKNLAQDNVQKKIADYVYGFWKDRYLTLPDDEVLSIANEISKIIDVKYNVLDSDDKILIRATLTAQIDDNDVMNYIIQFFKEITELKSQVEALRKEIEDLRRQIAELKRQQVNNQQNTSQVVSKNTLANQKSYKAKEILLTGDWHGAIKLYSEAIQLNPKGKFYYHRGCCYRKLGNHTKAQSDFKIANEFGYNG